MKPSTVLHYSVGFLTVAALTLFPLAEAQCNPECPPGFEPPQEANPTDLINPESLIPGDFTIQDVPALLIQPPNPALPASVPPVNPSEISGSSLLPPNIGTPTVLDGGPSGVIQYGDAPAMPNDLSSIVNTTGIMTSLTITPSLQQPEYVLSVDATIIREDSSLATTGTDIPSSFLESLESVLRLMPFSNDVPQLTSNVEGEIGFWDENTQTLQPLDSSAFSLLQQVFNNAGIRIPLLQINSPAEAPTPTQVQPSTSEEVSP